MSNTLCNGEPARVAREIVVVSIDSGWLQVSVGVVFPSPGVLERSGSVSPMKEEIRFTHKWSALLKRWLLFFLDYLVWLSWMFTYRLVGEDEWRVVVCCRRQLRRRYGRGRSLCVCVLVVRVLLLGLLLSC